jgi:DNA polymerase-3 subunit delta'
LARIFSKDLFLSNGFIAVSNDFDSAIESIKAAFWGETLIFPRPFKEQKDILVEDIEELMEAAYLTGEDRLFIIKSDTYSVVVQNKLLKLLEEPPSGIKFCLLVGSKAALLPTVCSRLPICELKTKKNVSLEPIDLSKFSAEGMFEILKKTESMEMEEAKEYLYMLLESYKKMELKKEPLKNMQKLELFDTAFKLLSLNTPPKIIFTTLLARLSLK